MARDFKNPQRGTILIVTLFFIVLLTFEVAMISFVMQRSVGEKAIGNTTYQAARNGSQVATQRLKDDLYAYIVANGTTNVLTDFAKGGANDIDNDNLMAYDAVAGINKDTGVDISAWVESDSRGVWYHIVSRGKFQESDILAHEWVKINDLCMSQSVAGGLTTILTNGVFPGGRSVYVSPSGRAFWGENSASGKFWSWSADTGLSTIVSGRAYPGYEGLGVTDLGRVFFGESTNPGNFYTWYNGLLTTIVVNRASPGRMSTEVFGERGFFGEESSGGNYYTWYNGLLTTIVSGGQGPGSQQATAIDEYGKVFFGEYSGSFTGKVWAWKDGSGLTTVASGINSPGRYSMAAGNGAVAFGEWTGSSNRFFIWKNGVLTTVIGNQNMGQNSTYFAYDGSIYFGNPESGNNANFYRWNSGQLTTIISGGSQNTGWGVRYYNAVDSSTNKVYIPQAHGSSGRFWSYQNGALTTIMVGHDPGSHSMGIDSNGWVFFGEYNTCCGPNHMRAYKNGVLSTIVTANPAKEVGVENFALAPTDHVFFGENANPGNFYAWKNNVLTTIVSGANNPGTYNRMHNLNSSLVSDEGRIFFGENANPGKFWTYSPDTSTSGCAY